MKIAFTTSGVTLDSPLSPRFGRAANFLVYDTSAQTVEVVPNVQNLTAVQGAGIQAAATVARTGAEAVVSGRCGPKAFRVLSAAGVKVYLSTAAACREALAEFEAGKLTAGNGADVEGRWQ